MSKELTALENALDGMATDGIVARPVETLAADIVEALTERGYALVFVDGPSL